MNGTSTGDFSISKTSVGDAITKINAISSTTGVKATASHDGTYITLLAENGADIDGYIKKSNRAKSKLSTDFLFSKPKDEKKSKENGGSDVVVNKDSEAIA